MKRRVADFTSATPCSLYHLPHVCSFAFAARSFSSFSKFSCVSTGAFVGGITEAFLGLLRAIVKCDAATAWKKGR